jgi:hypothetical protein
VSFEQIVVDVILVLDTELAVNILSKSVLTSTFDGSLKGVPRTMFIAARIIQNGNGNARGLS